MVVTFHNVTILVEAANPKEAYDKLCELIAHRDGTEWSTDTFTVGDNADYRDTRELWGRG